MVLPRWTSTTTLKVFSSLMPPWWSTPARWFRLPWSFPCLVGVSLPLCLPPNLSLCHPPCRFSICPSLRLYLPLPRLCPFSQFHWLRGQVDRSVAPVSFCCLLCLFSSLVPVVLVCSPSKHVNKVGKYTTHAGSNGTQGARGSLAS